MALFGAARPGADHAAALERVRDWTRARFALGPAEVVMVAQVACPVPGCPPLETVVVFWDADGVRHQFKLFKTPEQVLEPDIPYAWLKNSLRADEGEGFDCC
jgi:nitrate reductase delta subunit